MNSPSPWKPSENIASASSTPTVVTLLTDSLSSSCPNSPKEANLAQLDDDVCPSCGQTAKDGCEARCPETFREGFEIYKPPWSRVPPPEEQDTTWNTEDPVMGIEDVARGRGVVVPTTIYKQRNKSASGVMGLLTPDGVFHSKLASMAGDIFEVRDEDEVRFVAEVVWDGAQPSPIHAEPIGWWDEAQTQPIYQEGSKGILLAGYSNNGELWNCIALGRAMR